MLINLSLKTERQRWIKHLEGEVVLGLRNDEYLRTGPNPDTRETKFM